MGDEEYCWKLVREYTYPVLEYMFLVELARQKPWISQELVMGDIPWHLLRVWRRVFPRVQHFDKSVWPPPDELYDHFYKAIMGYISGLVD